MREPNGTYPGSVKGYQMTISKDPRYYLGRRTLFVGDVNSGKTSLTLSILEGMCSNGWDPRILVLDLAPQIPEDLARKPNLKGVGGTLEVPGGSQALYIRPPLLPPRLMAASQEEAWALAQRNRDEIDRILNQSWPQRDILFFNDLTIYLHAGDATRLGGFLRTFSTVVANGYKGSKLGEGPISQREREQLKALEEFFDTVVHL